MATIDEILQRANALEAQYSLPVSEPLSPVGQAIGTGTALPTYGTPRYTPFEAQGYQVMTPLTGALMTPARFTELPAEQRSAIELESIMAQDAKRKMLQAEQERLNRQTAATAFGLNAADAMALGLGTEGAAMIESLLPGRTYSDTIREYGTAKERLFESNPYASTAGAITGSIAPIVLTGAAGVGAQAARTGRVAPTLAEKLVGGVTSSEIKAAAGIVNQANKAAKLKELMAIGALQGGVSGAGMAEPTQGMSTTEGLLSRALGGGLGAVGGVAGVPVGIGLAKAGQAARSPIKAARSAAKRLGMTEITDLESGAAVADIAEAAGLTEGKLAAAMDAVDASGNPLMKQATTDEIVQVPGLSILREISQNRSEAGATGFWNKERQQLGKIQESLQQSVDNIDMTTPEKALQAQEKSQRYINLRQRELHKVGNEMYADLPENVNYSRKELVDEFSKLYKARFGAARGPVDKQIQYAFDYLTKRQFQDAGPLSARKFSPGAYNAQTNIGGRELVDLRSGLLQTARDLAESDPAQARLANELGQVVHDFIQKDATFGTKYAQANEFWSNLIDTFHTGSLSKVYDDKVVSLDNFASNVTKNINSWKQFQKQTGYNPQTYKEMLALQFQKFSEAGADSPNMLETVNAKLKYLDEMSKLMYKSPLDPKLKETYELAKQSLTNIKQLLQSVKSSKELVPANMSLDVLRTGTIDELAVMAASASEKAGGAPAQAFKAALRQFIRDKGRQGLSRTLSGAGILGLGGLAGYGAYQSDTPGGKLASVGAGALGALGLAIGGLRYNRMAAQNVLKLNEALTGALRNPELMKKAFEARSIVNATKSTSPQGLVNALSKTVPGKAAYRAVTAGAGMTAAGVANEIAEPEQAEQKKPSTSIDDILNRARGLEGQYTAPAEKPKGKSIGQKISDAIIPPAEAEVRKKESTAEKYLASRPPIIRAIAEVESSAKKHKSVSPKGAKGRMQLMGPAAKEVGVDRNDPLANVKGGEMYYNKMVKRFANFGNEFPLAGYNWGQGNLNKAINVLKEKRIPVTWANLIENVFVPAETQNYVRKVLSLEEKFRNRS